MDAETKQGLKAPLARPSTISEQTRTAQEIATALRQNVDAFYSDAITLDALRERNAVLWNEANRSALSHEVAVLVCPR